MTRDKWSGVPLIYKLTSPSGKVYIGQTTNWARRKAKHKSGNSNCRKLVASIKKYGWAAMNVEILIICDNKDLDFWECHFIDRFDATGPFGLNLMPGGDFNPMKEPRIYARVKKMHNDGIIKPLQKAGFTCAVRKKMSKSQKKRVAADGGAQVRAAAAIGQAAGTKAANTPESKQKRLSTWDRKREAKLATLSPEEAAKIVAQTKRKKTSYAEACAKAGGADKLREKQREWRRLRKERTFRANS